MASNQNWNTFWDWWARKYCFWFVFFWKKVHDIGDTHDVDDTAVAADVGADVAVDVEGDDSIGVVAVTGVDSAEVDEDSSNFFMVMIKLRLAHWSV